MIRSKTYLMLPILTMALANGCAKQAVVKENETMPVTAPATNKEAIPVSQLATGKGMQPQEIKDVPVTAMENQVHSKADHKEMVLSLEKVYFDFDSTALTSAARDAIVANGRLLSTTGRSRVRIEGHCDERGSDEYNLALGEKRAEAAFKYLSALGVPADNIEVISYGEEKPADAGHNETAWAKNRRDEFIIISE